MPAYAPQLAVAEVTGRERVDLVVDPDAERAEIDLDRLDALFAAGARTLLLTQPHNPWGRVFTRAELEGVRDVVVRHGARVVSDEIHAPLVLPGADHLSYLQLDGTHDHAVAVVAASKAFNTAGLRCAQVVVPDEIARKPLQDAPMVRNDSWSPLGVVAAVAAYTQGDDVAGRPAGPARTPTGPCSPSCWRASCPRPGCGGRRRPTWPGSTCAPTATTTRPRWRSSAAACGWRPATTTSPGLTGHVRLNFATSPERLRADRSPARLRVDIRRLIDSAP